MTYREFFKTATGNEPYDYQSRLAGGDSGAFCESKLISIPTGLGKTAAVVLAWLWNRLYRQEENWPRRLVYCLPMRTLVEQTAGNVSKWLQNLWDKRAELGLSDKAAEDLRWLSGEGSKKNARSPVILMGGEELSELRREWDIYPEKPAILIGTQDMLLSRALNRGYGMARARWPMHFGLLNNDALWILDETQLMGVAVRTSAQLEGLRHSLGAAADCKTWWASATLDTRLLNTIDHPHNPPELALAAIDLAALGVMSRVQAVKRLATLPIKLTADSAKARVPYIETLAQTIADKHIPETTTLVILNRVNRAQELFDELEILGKSRTLPQRIVVHSRFRPMERENLSAAIKAGGEKIIIATQAIEAGVDITSRTLITELAPWSSLVQRFGRCNRYGESNENGGADIFWLDLSPENAKAAAALALPYLPQQLETARNLLSQLEPLGASPSSLRTLNPQEPLSPAHILRRKDLIELFDTTPDLAGLDLDVARYIRDDDDRDVQLFWRSVPEDGPNGGDPGIEPMREELVRVPVDSFKKTFDRNKQRVWTWDALDGLWKRPDRIAPGQVYLVAAEVGGYSEKLGWTGEKSKQPFPLKTTADQPLTPSPRDGQGSDDESRRLRPEPEQAFQSIEEHTALVAAACREITAALPASAAWADVLMTAVHWHDVGKAHRCFQRFITRNQTIPPHLAESFIAKAPFRPGNRHERPYFRHELASALAWLKAQADNGEESVNLVAYLIASHHGKVRLSIRPMPGEKQAPEGQPFARGIWHGDSLPDVDDSRRLKIEGFSQPIILDLSCMEMGVQNGLVSWGCRCQRLRDDPSLGILRLAWLESLIRAADARGSRT